MRSVTKAVEAAEKRKLAVFGEPQGITYSETQLQERAMFSGFDLDVSEVTDIQYKAGAYFTRLAASNGLFPLFSSAWIDGLLAGLLLGQQTDEDDDVIHEPGT